MNHVGLVVNSTLFITAAEYHYDGGRQRYLVRQRDPNPDDPTLPEGPSNPRWTVIGTGQWRDYLGQTIYNDYTVDQAGTVTNGRAYIPGIGFDDPSLAETPAYLGTDLIGTTRRVTGSPGGTPPGGTGVSPVIHRNVLTAFGEPIASTSTSNTRYTYAGRWGYETPEQSYDPLLELGWLHVGVRYYDPSVGRFMQRDPIGINGGLNTYSYVESTPTIAIDPSGLAISSVQTPAAIAFLVEEGSLCGQNIPILVNGKRFILVAARPLVNSTVNVSSQIGVIVKDAAGSVSHEFVSTVPKLTKSINDAINVGNHKHIAVLIFILMACLSAAHLLFRRQTLLFSNTTSNRTRI